MESPKNLDFPDLSDGIYFFKGGYLVLRGGVATLLRHDNDRNNLEHLIKVHRFNGRLPDKYLHKIQLPKTEPGPIDPERLRFRQKLSDAL